MRIPDDVHRREPRLAAALNLLPLPLPLGYVYLDRPVRFTVATVARSAAAALTWTYLCCHVIGSCAAEGCPTGTGAWWIILVPPLVILAWTTWDAWTVAEAHNRRESSLDDERRPPRLAGRGTLTVMGVLGLLALGALQRTGDALSASLIVLVVSGWWLTWRRGRVRLPGDYEPPEDESWPEDRQ